MQIFLLTGEPSGDLHGAHLATALRARDSQLSLSGVGGARMRAAGVDLIAESDHWGAIGIPDALGKVPRLLWELHRLTCHLRTHPPDVLVLIDFGAFNMRLLRRLGAQRPRTVYYIPPGCWSRLRAPGHLPWAVDAIATPFPWSAENLRAAQGTARVAFVGHPVLEYTRAAASRAEARAALGIDPTRPVVALLPGSRRKELRYLLPVFLAAMRRLTPVPEILLAVAPSLGETAMRRHLPADLPVRLLNGLDYACLPAADAALVASGTATLELACLDLPMIVSYRGSFADVLQYHAIKHTLKYISLPNLLTDQPVVPELLQDHANPASLAATLTPLLTDTPVRRAQLAAFSQMRAQLGDGHAVEQTAEIVLAVASGDISHPA